MMMSKSHSWYRLWRKCANDDDEQDLIPSGYGSYPSDSPCALRDQGYRPKDEVSSGVSETPSSR
jgi:hypothetical protein